MMDHPGIPQSPLHGSQAREDSSCNDLQAHGLNLCNLSNTTSQLARHDERPGSHRMSSERSTLPLELLRLSNHRQDTRYPPLSAPPLRGPSSVRPSPYAPGRTQQDLVSLESQALQHATASPISNQYSFSSSYLEAFTPSDHPISHNRYDGEGTTASISRVEDPISHQGWRNHTEYGSPLILMDASGLGNFQESSVESYNAGAEQSNEQGPVVLSEMGSWESRRVRDGVNLSDFHHSADGLKCPFYRCSATDQREGLTINPRFLSSSGPLETNPARRNLGTHSQEIGYPVDPSALGIDRSLQPPYFPEVHGSFVEDANNTNTDARNSQNEEYPHDPGCLGNRFPSNPSSLAPRYAPGSENKMPPPASNLTPPSDHGAHSQMAPESSERCETCCLNFSNSENRRRHEREQHKDNVHHKCLLIKNGLACNQIVKATRNRRKHVKAVHPAAAKLLPPPSTNRRSNNNTDEMLNGWFHRVLQSSAQ